MRIVLLTLIAASAWGQTGQIIIRGKNGETKSVPITRRPKTFLTSASCVPIVIDAGAVATCTITINQPAPVEGYAASLDLPSWATGPSAATVPAGALSVTFSVTALSDATTGVPLQGALDPRQVDWQAVDPRAVLRDAPARPRNVQAGSGIDVAAIKLPAKWVDSWINTVKMAGPVAYGVQFTAAQQAPILSTCYRAGCVPAGLPWFRVR